MVSSVSCMVNFIIEVTFVGVKVENIEYTPMSHFERLWLTPLTQEVQGDLNSKIGLGSSSNLFILHAPKVFTSTYMPTIYASTHVCMHAYMQSYLPNFNVIK